MNKISALKNRLNNLKKNRKGFTLIEIIVVLVIIAVLAGAAIPTMLGFIEDARGKSLIAEARAGYVAVQSVYTEVTLSTGEHPAISSTTHQFDDTDTAGAVAADKFEKMLAPDLDPDDFRYVFGTPRTDNEGQLLGITYRKLQGGSYYYISLEPGKAAVVDKEAKADGAAWTINPPNASDEE